MRAQIEDGIAHELPWPMVGDVPPAFNGVMWNVAVTNYGIRYNQRKVLLHVLFDPVSTF
jgi:hypothetical protein